MLSQQVAQNNIQLFTAAGVMPTTVSTNVANAIIKPSGQSNRFVTAVPHAQRPNGGAMSFR